MRRVRGGDVGARVGIGSRVGVADGGDGRFG
jgi:hypothetical protein